MCRAEVMSADAFAAFEEVGLDYEDEVRKTGLKFRDTVLSMVSCPTDRACMI